MRRNRIILLLIICLMSCSLMTGCSFEKDFKSFFGLLCNKIEQIEEMTNKDDNQNSSSESDDSEFDDSEPIYLGTQTIGDIELAEGEVAHID